MFKLISQLNRAGVLGINRRNADFTLKHNKRSLFPLVDDKLATKGLAVKAGVAAPEVYGVMEFAGQVAGVHDLLQDRPDFVVKPARGSGGEGIMVIAGRMNDRYRTVSGNILGREDLEHHLYEVLSGLFSLGGQNDQAIIEYRVVVDPVFDAITHQGVPDIRIIVLYGVPVMAMVRLPTRMSGGKANLHQGAIGAGVDLASGRTLRAVWKNEVVESHPDTGNPVSGVAVPQWDELLRLASQLATMTGLGYQGVDMVLDHKDGPMVLEINARPGLNIQIANQAGLRPRLEKVLQEGVGLATWQEKVAFAKRHFGVRA